MPARLVRPAPSALLGGGTPDEGSGQPLDLEGLFRRAATDAVAASADAQDVDGPSLAEDTLEALACIACEILGDGGGAKGDDLEEQRSVLLPELIPVFDEAAVSEDLRNRIVDALLAAARGGAGEAPKLIRPPPPSRAAPVSDSGPKYRKRGEVEKARADEYLEEHEKLLDLERIAEEARERELAKFYHVTLEGDAPPPSHGAPGAFNPAAAAGVAPGSPSSSDSEEEVEDASTKREREASKQRLRELGEPATLFGESDEARTERLNRLELNRDQDTLATGSTNVLQMVSRNAQRGVNMDHDEEDFHVAGSRKPPVPLPALVDIGGSEPLPLPMDDKDLDDEGLDAVDESIKAVSLWLRATLREWETELTSRQADEKHLRSFALERGQFRQSKQYLRPLRKALRDGSVNPVIVTSMHYITSSCEKKDYKEAKEAYMRLAIGNQAWPMGVTNITFHDRPNRHNIGEDNVAHILNDETTRKYVQMVKRLVTYAEKRWPVASHIA